MTLDELRELVHRWQEAKGALALADKNLADMVRCAPIKPLMAECMEHLSAIRAEEEVYRASLWHAHNKVGDAMAAALDIEDRIRNALPVKGVWLKLAEDLAVGISASEFLGLGDCLRVADPREPLPELKRI
jgi:hypothetical protein